MAPPSLVSGKDLYVTLDYNEGGDMPDRVNTGGEPSKRGLGNLTKMALDTFLHNAYLSHNKSLSTFHNLPVVVLFIRKTPWSVDFFDKVWEHNDEGRGVSDQVSGSRRGRIAGLYIIVPQLIASLLVGLNQLGPPIPLPSAFTF